MSRNNKYINLPFATAFLLSSGCECVASMTFPLFQLDRLQHRRWKQYTPSKHWYSPVRLMSELKETLAGMSISNLLYTGRRYSFLQTAWGVCWTWGQSTEASSATCLGAWTFLEATARGSRKKCEITSVMVRKDVDLFPNLVQMAHCKASLSVSVSAIVNYVFSKWGKISENGENYMANTFVVWLFFLWNLVVSSPAFREN